jgi:hypothetical protein
MHCVGSTTLQSAINCRDTRMVEVLLPRTTCLPLYSGLDVKQFSSMLLESGDRLVTKLQRLVADPKMVRTTTMVAVVCS